MANRMNSSAVCARLGLAALLTLGAAHAAFANVEPSSTATASATASATATPTADPSSAASAESADDPKMAALASTLVAQAQSGKIDRDLFDGKAGDGLTPALIANVAQHMAPLGKPKSITFESHATVGAYDTYHYRVAWPAVAVDESFTLDRAGKIAGWYFQPTT